MTEPVANRRPLKSRQTGWAKRATALLLRTGITPDAISLLGIAFAVLGSWAAIAAPANPFLFLLAALGIQLRLLCNLLDGLVAIEGSRKSAYGPLFNELPDRIEDSALLVGSAMRPGCSGWACSQPCLPRSPLIFARLADRSVLRRISGDRWPSRTAWRR